MSRGQHRWGLRALAAAATTVAVVATGAGPGTAAGTAASTATGAAGPPDGSTSAGVPVDLDALYVGAHPDDEAFTLAAFGQWGEDSGLRTGVVTVTRGEGGGNAVGPEEGPALGLIREAEERSAVGLAGITEVFNLDAVDFYYTVSAPLTQQVWGEQATLAKVVRLVRQTRPELLVTMDPAPSPGNHGNHQEAGRLALQAYRLAGDPAAFPEQVTREGLRPFAPSRILVRGADGTDAPGSDCASTFVPEDPTAVVYGAWSGRRSARHDGRTWAAVARDAQRRYVSQGWAVFPDEPSDPAELGCVFFTEVDSRVPGARAGSTAAAAAAAPLYGATVRMPGGVPLGSGLSVAPARSDVRAGQGVRVTATATAPERAGLGYAWLSLQVPDGWRVSGDGRLGLLRAGETRSVAFTVTPPATAREGTRVRVGAALRSDAGQGWTYATVRVTPAVTAAQQPLPQVAEFDAWAASAGYPQLLGSVLPVLTLPSGGSREVRVDLRSSSSRAESGVVTLDPPAGFAARPASRAYRDLEPGGTASVTFTVRSTDPAMPTGTQGGDHPYTLSVTSSQGTSSTSPALELVPSADVPPAGAAPVVDGRAGAGEYAAAPLDVSRLWEGSPCDSPADCSASARVSWFDGDLYVLVQVADDVAGTALDARSDCKRHWRTDSVEIAVDPTGAAENTSATYKAYVLPRTAQGPACAGRDADNRQGPAAATAPGMDVAVVPDGAGAGYTVEVRIAAADLPDAVDPQRLGLNVFVYDSDTQDKTGQTRLGWSTWGGVQGDPYRWGRARLLGYTPPAGAPDGPVEPVVPTEALSSLDSPLSLAQAVRVDVPLAGGPTSRQPGWVLSATGSAGAVAVRLRATGPGRMTLFVRDAAGTAGQRDVRVTRAGTSTVRVPLDRATRGSGTVLAGWSGGGGTLASQARVGVGADGS